MQRQLTKILLGIAVIAIWGTVFYRVYKALAPSDDLDLPVATFVPVTKEQRALDTFALLADYRDPFLGNRVGSSGKRVRRSAVVSRPAPAVVPVAPKVKPKPKKAVVFPAIVFKGYVENKGVKTLLISIDERNQYLRPGQTLDGLRVVRAYEDSVRLGFEGAKRTFLRE